MKKIVNIVVLAVIGFALSACLDVSDTNDSVTTSTTGTLVGTVNGVDRTWRTTKIVTVSSAGTFEENTAKLERDSDSVNITISGVDVAFEEEMSLYFEFPKDALTTGILQTNNLVSIVDGNVGMYSIAHPDSTFDVEITYLVDNITHIDIEGTVSNVTTQDSSGNIYTISFDFVIDASERIFNGEVVN